MADGNKETALGLGERLRSARKARALTLEQAAFSIRLEASVLRALEDERYAVLGAAVFVRGHLKAYARLLGLSEEAILAAYRASDPNADAPPTVTRELEKPLTTPPGPIAIGLAVVFAIVALLVLYAISSGPDPVPKTAPTLERSPTVEIVPALPAEPELPVNPGPAVAAPTTPAPLPAPTTAVVVPAEVAEPEPAPATAFE
jgi:cytoskeleton protein RodZ